MRTKKITHRLISLLLGLAFLAGCSQFSPAPEETEAPDIAADDFVPVVSATGVVLPAVWSRISVTTAGVIAELPVREDEVVAQGQVLVRLEGAENLEAAVAATQFELASAQRALDDLYKNPELRVAQAETVVVEAQQALRDAERYLQNLQTSAPQADIDQARANLALARDKLEQAREDFEPYAKKPEDNLVRAALLSRRAQAEKEYENAARRYNNLTGTANDLDVAEAEADVALAEARLAVAERELATYRAGPDPADVALAEERHANARAQLSAAQSALEDLVLVAPFAGTITELSVRVNEWVAPGQPVVVLADLDHLRVETTDLNEIDVARVRVGDQALVTFDALPEYEVTGTVMRIASKAAAGSGVNYPVILELEEIPAELRWGMTAFVDIEVE